MNRKAIPYSEFLDLKKSSKFTLPDERPARAMCGACNSDRNDADETFCNLCGAKLADGYVHVGSIHGQDLYVKPGEITGKEETAEATRSKKDWRK
jgi:hypothetical protein